jgi:hypothetical protein
MEEGLKSEQKGEEEEGKTITNIVLLALKYVTCTFI